MTFTTVTAVVAICLTWITLATFIYRSYRKAKASITEWADTLLDNHATHMQASLERIEIQGDAQIELLKRIADK